MGPNLLNNAWIFRSRRERVRFGSSTPGGNEQTTTPRSNIYFAGVHTHTHTHTGVHEGKFNPKYESCTIVAQGSKSEDLSRLG